jgi:Domain of unknown function (DUF4333)
MRRLWAFFGAVALVAAVVLAGCGETVLDTTKIEEQVKSDLEKSLPTRKDLQKELGIGADEKIKAVDCPSGVEVKAGEKFTCKISFANGVEGTETFEVINDKADVHITSSLEPSDGANE